VWIEIVRKGFLQSDEIYVDVPIGKANTLLSMGIAQEIRESNVDAVIKKYQDLKAELFNGTHPECKTLEEEKKEMEEKQKDSDIRYQAFQMAMKENVKSKYTMSKSDVREMEERFFAELKAAHPEVSKSVAEDVFAERLEDKMIDMQTVVKKTRGRKPKPKPCETDTGDYNING
jgi:hypothetical protein